MIVNTIIKFAFPLCCIMYAESKTVEVLGAGASFPSAVYTQWIHSYRRHRVRHVDLYMRYDSIGSGGGKARIKGEQLPKVHYAGSDILLTDEEQRANPDLITFPTMAGAIVITYNIPGLNRLNLDMESVTAIYNGTLTKWNDPMIAKLNAGTLLPDVEIIVIARADKSGTTRAFTSGLSSFSPDWKTTYGTFSEGRDRNTMHFTKWKNDVVKFFGQGNRGMSGLILSIDYTIGYIAIADAISSGLQYARLVNSAGNLINATDDTVQNSIVSANGSYDITNTPGEFAYPLASFTYFIVQRTGLTDCDAATELIRYINWFYFTDSAKNILISHNMVPMDNYSATEVVNKVIKGITCRGNNVWTLMLQQIEEENKIMETKSWQLPVLLTFCIVLAVVTGLGVHFGRQQIFIHRELLKDSWRIDERMISLDRDTLIDGKMNGSESRSSSMKDDLLIHEDIVFTQNCPTIYQACVGAFRDQPITVIKMRKHNIDFTLAVKKKLIWMRDGIKHANVLPFFGVTKLDGRWNMVHHEIFLGSLSHILKSEKIEIHTEGLIALSKSLVNGLLYLHRKGIVHGHLTGMNCLIDTSWELRIAGWIESNIENSTKPFHNKISSAESVIEEDKISLLWVAPEIVKFRRAPTQTSDIYSLSMVFQEMFTRKQPYYELSMTTEEIINAVLTCGIRPHFSTETPLIFQSIMEQSWEMDQAARPKLETIYNSIKAAFPSKYSFLDCVIRSVQSYARKLEEKNKDQEFELNELREKVRLQMTQNMPLSVVNKIITKTKVGPEVKDGVCVLVCRLANISTEINNITAYGLVNVLNTFYTGTDQLLLGKDIYRLNRCCTESTFIVGLTRKENMESAKKVIVNAASVALQLNTFADKINKENNTYTNLDLKLQTGLAGGSVIVGFIGNVFPQYVAFGGVIEESLELARNAHPGEIAISGHVHSCLKDIESIKTKVCIRKEITSYTLET
ncbi:speract receptor-like isoform X2 [Ruditapes philippinarum]|uniref:speract receptor-like isoform X2 n=1 Tax=Ruditapes philippinarum TaxID=129788 RepID=UPI00295AE442|nr:speract receptor-like isoform X2 [Ruditapes philippinarum]